MIGTTLRYSSLAYVVRKNISPPADLTQDYTANSLTNWGYKQASANPHVAGGGVIHKLLMRAYPGFYVANSVYAMFPFTVPSETRKILGVLEKANDYDFMQPSFVGPPSHIESWSGITSVLNDEKTFKVPYAPRIQAWSGYAYMLRDDSRASAKERADIQNALYQPRDGLHEIRQFYEILTMQLVRQNSAKLGKSYQIDAVRFVGNASHANFIGYLFGIPMLDSSLGSGDYTDLEFYEMLASVYAYVFVDLDPPSSFALKVAAAESARKISNIVRALCKHLINNDTAHLLSAKMELGTGPAADSLRSYGWKLIRRISANLFTQNEDWVAWNIVNTAAAAVATQAQGFAQMLELYLSGPHKSHWPAIQKLAASNSSEAFEQLKRYALEGYRLSTPTFGLTRIADADTTIEDGKRSVPVKKGDRVFVNLATACLDPNVFPNPEAIDLTRPLHKYIHHGSGSHTCIARPIVETAMAAQLRVFAQLKNLRPAPGVAGKLKSKTVNGSFRVFMKEDWSDWSPFPACKFNIAKSRPGR